MKTYMSFTSLLVSAAAALFVAAQVGMASSTIDAIDPGVRPGPGAGNPIAISAIRAHASQGSEANGVVAGFQELGEVQKQHLLNFLRSL